MTELQAFYQFLTDNFYIEMSLMQGTMGYLLKWNLVLQTVTHYFSCPSLQ